MPTAFKRLINFKGRQDSINKDNKDNQTKILTFLLGGITAAAMACLTYLSLKNLQKTTKVIKQVEKKLGDNGRILVRYSGTEKLLRVMLEGQDKKEIKKIAQTVIDVAKKEIEEKIKGK